MIGLMIIVFLATVVAVLAIGMALDRNAGRGQILRDRLKAVDSVVRRGPSPDLEVLRDELLSGIPVLNKMLARWSRSSHLQLLLEQAGTKLRPGKFVLVCACTAAVTGSIVLVMGPVAILSLAGVVLGAVLPVSYILILRRRRFKRFEAMFPQAIDLLVRSTRAGHPFTTSIEMIGTEMAEPLAGEFRRIYEEQKFGLPVRDALRNLAERVPLMDVKFFVTALTLQRETGGNLAEILDQLSHVIRERFKIMRQVRVYTAQGRLTMMLLMAIPPGMVVFMSFANPEFMKPLLTDPMGHFLIGLGVLLQSIGFVLIRRIIDIKV